LPCRHNTTIEFATTRATNNTGKRASLKVGQAITHDEEEKRCREATASPAVAGARQRKTMFARNVAQYAGLRILVLERDAATQEGEKQTPLHTPLFFVTGPCTRGSGAVLNGG
jgi:hypothetical protein